jgi:hypothetical protein
MDQSLREVNVFHCENFEDVRVVWQSIRFKVLQLL